VVREKLSGDIKKILGERGDALEMATPLSNMVTVIVECLLEQPELSDNENPFLYQPEGQGVAGHILADKVGIKGVMTDFCRFDYWRFRGNDSRYKLLSLLDNFIGVGGVSANYFFGYPLFGWNSSLVFETQGVLYFTGSQDKVNMQTPVKSVLAVHAFIEVLRGNSLFSQEKFANCAWCNENAKNWKYAVEALFPAQDGFDASGYVDELTELRNEKAKHVICFWIYSEKRFTARQAKALFDWEWNPNPTTQEDWFQTASWQ
jgi:hypothetical protein